MAATYPLTRCDEPATDRRRGDTGQAGVVVVTIAAVLLVAILSALAAMGTTTVHRTRAQTAADAAALASVDGDRSAAQRLARVHGAEVVAWTAGPGPHEVTVTVRLGNTTATARASNAP